MDDLIFADDGAFPAGEKVPGQKVSRNAYEVFLENTGMRKSEALREELKGIWPQMEEAPTWLESYQDLRAKGWDWRKAAFIAWSACPTDKRWPKTIGELAVTVLGLRSDRAIRKWRENDPRIDEQIGKMLISEMMDHRQDAIQAMIAVASKDEASGFNDRQMLLKITGVIKDKVQMEHVGPYGGPVLVEGAIAFGDLADDELERVIANLQAAERATGNGAG